MDKNIVGYCGYIDLISFVAYRPDIAALAPRVRGGATRRSASRQRLLTRRDRRIPRVDDPAIDALPQNRPDLTTGSALLQKDFKKVWRRNVTSAGVLTEDRRQAEAAPISSAVRSLAPRCGGGSGGNR
jgi:hypothetical protein